MTRTHFNAIALMIAALRPKADCVRYEYWCKLRDGMAATCSAQAKRSFDVAKFLYTCNNG